MKPDIEDIAAMREQGDLRDYLLSLVGASTPAKPKETPPAAALEPTFHIARPGAWPCGTAPTGPTPPPCTHQTAR